MGHPFFSGRISKSCFAKIPLHQPAAIFLSRSTCSSSFGPPAGSTKIQQAMPFPRAPRRPWDPRHAVIPPTFSSQWAAMRRPLSATRRTASWSCRDGWGGLVWGTLDFAFVRRFPVEHHPLFWGKLKHGPKCDVSCLFPARND